MSLGAHQRGKRSEGTQGGRQDRSKVDKEGAQRVTSTLREAFPVPRAEASWQAVRQAVKLIKAEGANIAGVVIALDRAEYGPSGETAVDSVAADLGAPLISIAGVADVIHFIQGREDLQSTLRSMRDYQQAYCKLA